MKLSPAIPNAIVLAATSGVTAGMKDFVSAYKASSGMTKIQESIRSITAMPGIQEMLARQSESLLSPSMRAMTKMLSEQATSATKSVALSTEVAAMLGSIEKNSARGLTPSVMKDLERFATVVPIHDVIAVRQTRTSVTRPTPSKRTSADEVDSFLEWVRPDLPNKRHGSYEALSMNFDPVSAAANSATELMRHLFDGLVPKSEVWLHMQNTNQLDPTKKRPAHPPWRQRLAVMAATYGLDETSLVLMYGTPGISKRIEDIKHDTHMHTRADVLRVLASIEELLEYLAATISRT